jgi:hypothetical protein
MEDVDGIPKYIHHIIRHQVRQVLQGERRENKYNNNSSNK